MSTKTHYDNLNVARDATSDVIRAAYKGLTQKYHSGASHNTDTSQLMRIINKSFAVLSNPVQRAEYDRLLHKQESTEVLQQYATTPSNKKSNFYRWLVYGTIGLIIVFVLRWFDVWGSDNETKSSQTPLKTYSNVSNALPSPTALTEMNSITEVNTITEQIIIPIHDPADIDAFIGLWNGANKNSAGKQTLNMQLKSDDSMVFRLDAKAGQKIGAVYGVARFENDYARFFNKEYGCSIIFSIKSNNLNLTTSGCQAYHETGVTFDGVYTKPSIAKVETKVVSSRTKPKVMTNDSANTNTVKPTEIQPVIPTNSPKLRKFSVTVKDSTGIASTIELLAKDKDAARAIIRDFRGNPTIVKIKEVKK